MEVWLDLEDTIITGWKEGLLLNPGKIKKWLDDRDVKEIRIWSFAIWNEADKKRFVGSGMKQMIETALERPILEWPSMAEMQVAVQHYEGIIYDSRTEFMQLNSKKWSFIKYCLGHKKNTTCVLIDDAVPNMTIKELDLLLTIELIKVQTL